MRGWPQQPRVRTASLHTCSASKKSCCASATCSATDATAAPGRDCAFGFLASHRPGRPVCPVPDQPPVTPPTRSPFALQHATPHSNPDPLRRDPKGINQEAPQPNTRPKRPWMDGRGRRQVTRGWWGSSPPPKTPTVVGDPNPHVHGAFCLRNLAPLNGFPNGRPPGAFP